MTLYEGIVSRCAAVTLCFAFAWPVTAQDTAKDNAATALLVVPEAKGHRLVLVDPRSKSIAGSLPEPGWPHEVAFSRDGRTA